MSAIDRSTRPNVVYVLAAAALIGTTVGVWSLGNLAPVQAAPATTVDCDVPTQNGTSDPVDLTSYSPITPLRIVDTREGRGGHEGIVPADCTLRIELDDVLDDDTTAVALSVTAVSSFRAFVTVFPCASGRPPTSNLNTRDDAPTPAFVAVAPDAAGDVCVYSKLDAHVIVDVQGLWGQGDSRFTPITPVRAYDTRELPGRPPLPAGGVRNVPIADVVVPGDATAVVANVTVTETSAPGWVVAYPCGVEPPLASNLNYEFDESRAIAAVVGLGVDKGGEGQLCIRTKETTHFIVDVVGYYSPAPQFGPETSVTTATRRIADTRSPAGPWTQPFEAEEVRLIDPLVGHPDRDEATSVTLNAIGLNAADLGFLGFYPCDDASDPRPIVSSLNTAPGSEVANLVTVEVGAGGAVCVFSKSAADVVLDLVAVGTVDEGSPFRRLDLGGAVVEPAFDPAVTDYAMICPDAVSTISIDAVGHQGRSVRIDNATTQPTGVRTVQLRTDDELTIRVGASPDVAGSTPTVYHIRCLPSDFPQLVVERPGLPTAGWYLTALRASSPGSSFVMLLDERGVPTWYKRVGSNALNPQLLSTGEVVYDLSSGPYGADAGGVATVINLDGTVRRTVTTDDPAEFPLDHHELIELPDGGWTTLSYPLRSNVDLTVLNGPPDDYPPRPPEDGDAPQFGDDEFVADNSIREIDADGNLVWEWTASEHFALGESQYPVRFFQYRDASEGGEVDLYHINSVSQVDDGSADYIVTARHLDAVARIDRGTSALSWILTSPSADGSELPPNPDGAVRLDVVGDPLGGPRRPHDGRLVGDVLTLFDNRTATGQPARSVAYRIDAAAGTATLLWQIDDPAGRSSSGLGVTRVAADGSVLVGWGGLQPMFAEYDEERALLFSIEQIPSGTAFRIVKYPLDAFDLAELRRTAGGSVTGPG